MQGIYLKTKTNDKISKNVSWNLFFKLQVINHV